MVKCLIPGAWGLTEAGAKRVKIYRIVCSNGIYMRIHAGLVNSDGQLHVPLRLGELNGAACANFVAVPSSR
jgi:hypothetical protein